jgi:hypothetical protein
VVILHHPAKTEGSTGRGSSAIKGAADVAFLQEMADPNDGGLITLKFNKNRFGETMQITIRPDFDEGTFEVTDSPKFTQRSNDLEKLRDIILANPGLSQNSIVKVSGMMKARVGHLLKEGIETFWDATPGPNRSVRYYPVGWFPNLRTTDGTTEPQDEQSVGGSGGSPLKGGEPPNHTTSGTAPGGSGAIAGKPNGKTLLACSGCGSYALYRLPEGGMVCQSCGGAA